MVITVMRGKIDSMRTHQPFLIKHVTVYAEDVTYTNGFIKVTNGKIEEIGKVEDLTDTEDYEILDVAGKYSALPGMIDVHIHGVAGADTMDATPEALEIMKKQLPKEGTTSFLSTTMTQSADAIEKALYNVAQFMPNQSFDSAEILGVHLEGPFISPKRAGAQPMDYIRKPDIELFKKWQQIAKASIKLVTLAPEEENGIELVQYLKDSNVVASIGHSDANLVHVDNAVAAGATHVTHLFNGMRGLSHREPGTAGAALLREELYTEIIVDGIHVHPEMIQLAYKLKTSDRVILITDSIRAKCMKQGNYDLGGQSVTVTDNKAFLSDGTLAGSILEMKQAIQNFKEYTGCTIKDIIQITSTNPAKQLNVINRKGSIKPGKDADLILVDDHLDIHMTFCRGHLAFEKN
jgi:N-acetylglucosamine-6-phosphate deacetylase